MSELNPIASSHLNGKTPPLRFGVMSSGTTFQHWQADALTGLHEHGHRLIVMIVDGRTVQKTSLIHRILKKKWSTFLYMFLEKRVFKPAAKKLVSLSTDFPDVTTLTCIVEQKGFSEYFQDTDIETIKKFQLDFILRFGFSIIRGNILSAARFGVWSFHHDDEMIYRGGPPGFWEIFRGDPVNGAMMQRLTDKLDGGVILKKGYLKTIMHSYRENLNQLLSVTSSWPALVADELSGNMLEIQDVVDQPDVIASKTDAPLYKIPGNGEMLKFLYLLLRNRIRFYYRDFIAAELWNVGIIGKPIHEVALGTDIIREAEVTWLAPVPGSRYLADPSGFMIDDKLHILAEDYSYSSQKAGISEIIVEFYPVRVTNPAKVINADRHLSYPYVLQHNGEIYCLPESHKSCNITLYRRDFGTGKFTQERVMLEAVEAVDPTLVFFNGLWWLFFTDRKYSNTHLFLYHAHELTGEFKPHRLNPIKIDIRSARPAGTPFIHKNVLYRPAQDCAGTYGGRIAINRVFQLTPEVYIEKIVKFIEPVQGSRYSHGLHTLCSVGNFTLIDGKTHNLDRHFFRHQLWKRLKKKGSEDV
ncbi:MAG: hypothetical protein Q8M08_17075 [Bacteroidales bacterium]|nr:hypothetical protein [Bacteroidales bacterium]